MLVFDKWTCNTNGRQTLFLAGMSSHGNGAVDVAGGLADSGVGASSVPGGSYRTLMIDQGFCFNAGEWKFPDAPLRDLYARNRVYGDHGRFRSVGR